MADEEGETIQGLTAKEIKKLARPGEPASQLLKPHSPFRLISEVWPNLWENPSHLCSRICCQSREVLPHENAHEARFRALQLP